MALQIGKPRRNRQGGYWWPVLEGNQEYALFSSNNKKEPPYDARQYLKINDLLKIVQSVAAQLNTTWDDKTLCDRSREIFGECETLLRNALAEFEC